MKPNLSWPNSHTALKWGPHHCSSSGEWIWFLCKRYRIYVIHQGGKKYSFYTNKTIIEWPYVPRDDKCTQSSLLSIISPIPFPCFHPSSSAYPLVSFHVFKTDNNISISEEQELFSWKSLFFTGLIVQRHHWAAADLRQPERVDSWGSEWRYCHPDTQTPTHTLAHMYAHTHSQSRCIAH